MQWADIEGGLIHVRHNYTDADGAKAPKCGSAGKVPVTAYVAEHPFGTEKAVWGYKQFLCCGKVKVTAETAPAYLAYNIRRAVNIFGAEGNGVHCPRLPGGGFAGDLHILQVSVRGGVVQLSVIELGPVTFPIRFVSCTGTVKGTR
ncbi:MAG: hypothetical protein LBG57_10340 [Treponema sp.]|nr:hypothetical protein [Treponema sp.]